MSCTLVKCALIELALHFLIGTESLYNKEIKNISKCIYNKKSYVIKPEIIVFSSKWLNHIQTCFRNCEICP